MAQLDESNSLMSTEIIYDCRRSSQVDDKFVDDFIKVEREVFGNDYDRAYFNHKFINNPYGESVLAVVYIAGLPSAARALWRNDIDGKESYQPGDTCVLASCRGKGVFSEMTGRTVDMLHKNALIYNFPNPNSYPGYIKMGWTLQRECHLVLLGSNKKYRAENPANIDDAYARWWIPTDRVRRIRRGSTYYLVVKYARPFCYKVLGAVGRETAKRYKPLLRPGLLFYCSTRQTWYNKPFMTLKVVSNHNPDNIFIPTWKIDAL